MSLHLIYLLLLLLLLLLVVVVVVVVAVVVDIQDHEELQPFSINSKELGGTSV